MHCLENKTIEFRLAEDLCDRFRKGEIILGKFKFIDQQVISCIYKQL